MLLRQLDKDIANAWNQSYQSYSEIGNQPVNEADLAPEISSESDEPGDEIVLRVSPEIPGVEELINKAGNREELEQEIKNAVMKFYWDGYYAGFAASRRERVNEEEFEGTVEENEEIEDDEYQDTNEYEENEHGKEENIKRNEDNKENEDI